MRVKWKRLEKSKRESTERIQEDEDNTGDNNDKVLSQQNLNKKYKKVNRKVIVKSLTMFLQGIL
jgi:hypothetical protein